MEERSAILRWTGHPLVDVGVAALTAFAGKRHPAHVTAADLREYAAFAERHYLSGDLSKTVDVLFTRNSFLNPSFKLEQKRQRIREAILAFETEQLRDPSPCTWCGRPAARLLHRDDVPMLAGRTTVNFYPGGAPGIAVCAGCQAALHGLAIGAPRCSGKALVVHADDPDLLVDLIRNWVNQAVRYAQLGDTADAPAIKNPRTRVIEALLRIHREAAVAGRDLGLVVYHISNSGQGPGIELFTLPSVVVRFVLRASSQAYRDAWSAIEGRAWQRIGKSRTAADLREDQRQQYRNFLYEDLFRLPEDSARFIRLYLLRKPAGLTRRGNDDPRSDYHTGKEIDVLSWNLTELFLREVVGMDQERIAAIRSLGDRLAEEIDEDNNRRLLRQAYSARDYGTVRRLLIRANLARLNRKSIPIIGFDDFLVVFEEGEELARVDWRLAWDLVLIRAIEELHRRGKTQLIQEAVSDVANQEEMAESEPAMVE
jgi:CRISPR-associated protein Cst1